MKFLFYINSLANGGAERAIANLANGLADRGHTCIVLTSFKCSNEYSLSNKVKRDTLDALYYNSNRVVKNIRLVNALRKHIRSYAPQVLISFMAEPCMRSIFATLGTRTKLLLSVRSDPQRVFSGCLIRRMVKYFYRFADGIVFQTEEARDWFPKKIQRKSEIIFNPVRESFFESEYCGDKNIVVSVGRLEPPKNFNLLIDAFALIADRINDNLEIYGEGSMRSIIQSRINDYGMEDRIFLRGSTKNVADVLSHSKLFVLSSNSEGMPNALMEAMSVGVPCIATDCPCGGPRSLFGDLLRDNLVLPRDVKALSDKMLELLTNQEERGIVSSRCKILSQQFHSEKIIGAWERYLCSLCSHRR